MTMRFHKSHYSNNDEYSIMLLVVLIVFLSLCPAATSLAQNQTVTYLENSDHELTIYFINGREPGNTMMIIGGIQGDEPGGYLAADLYADMLLEKGNLIVVPRANFYSIKRNNRGVNGDMNRKFSSAPANTNDHEEFIVDILKSLIMKSDVLLNLHDGSGFFHPDYISELRNPMRYGQSIIADASTYTCPDGSIIELEKPARRIIEKVNNNIRNSDHLFHFNNHKTLSEYSAHKEQRKSATFFSLTEANIPAFGIETSKSIASSETKVRYQTMIINTFMAEYGIIPMQPSVFLPPPELEHLVIEIVGMKTPFAVKNGDTLEVPVGSSIHITSVIANYKRGLSVDIENIGNTNDLERVSTIKEPTTVTVYKDAYVCGKIYIKPSEDDDVERIAHVSVSSSTHLSDIEFRIDGKNMVVSDADTLHIVKGDRISIVDARLSDKSETGYRVNFVGFVGNSQYNDAEDRGYQIDTGRDLLERFSIDGEGGVYLIRVQHLETKELIGEVYVSIEEPRIDFVILERQDGTRLALSPGSVVDCQANEHVTLLSAVSNISCPPDFDICISEKSGGSKMIHFPATIIPKPGTSVTFKRTTSDLGSVSFRISG